MIHSKSGSPKAGLDATVIIAATTSIEFVEEFGDIDILDLVIFCVMSNEVMKGIVT